MPHKHIKLVLASLAVSIESDISMGSYKIYLEGPRAAGVEHHYHIAFCNKQDGIACTRILPHCDVWYNMDVSDKIAITLRNKLKEIHSDTTAY